MTSQLRSVLTLAAGTIVVLAAWPFFLARQEAAASPPAPAAITIAPDYGDRDRLVAFWEKAAGEHPNDQISPRILADEYLQRYRERGDVDDVFRAIAAAKRSLRAQSKGNVPGDLALASGLLELHLFRRSESYVDTALAWEPQNPGLLARKAGLELEIGDFDRAAALLARAKPDPVLNPAVATVRSRLLELTGHLNQARALLRRVSAMYDANLSAPLQARSWYHYRLGEMAFEAGDIDEAIADERTSIAIFPNNQLAYNAVARFEWATKDWRDALADAKRAAAIIPYPETLGYEADAQRALGQAQAAARTNDLIRTIERIGNAQRISDRLLAIYYSDHGLYPDDAYRIARRELALRDDVYTEDTIAWAAAMDGHWNAARAASRKATRYDTPDSRIHFHAGMIDLHFGDRAGARRELAAALALNPRFHPVYADEARAELARLDGRS